MLYGEQTPLHRAAERNGRRVCWTFEKNDKDVAELLIKSGADFNAKERTVRTSFVYVLIMARSSLMVTMSYSYLISANNCTMSVSIPR